MEKKKRKSKHRWTKEEVCWIKENVKGISLKELTDRFNKTFGLSISKNAIGMKKYKCEFKSDVKFNMKPIGTERTLNTGFIEVKIENPNKWKLKHHIIFEKEHGKIKKEDRIIFIDGNKYNFDIQNLCLLSNSENLMLHVSNLKSTDINITKAAITLTKIKSKLNKIKKEKLK